MVEVVRAELRCVGWVGILADSPPAVGLPPCPRREARPVTAEELAALDGLDALGVGLRAIGAGVAEGSATATLPTLDAS